MHGYEESRSPAQQAALQSFLCRLLGVKTRGPTGHSSLRRMSSATAKSSAALRNHSRLLEVDGDGGSLSLIDDAPLAYRSAFQRAGDPSPFRKPVGIGERDIEGHRHWSCLKHPPPKRNALDRIETVEDTNRSMSLSPVSSPRATEPYSQTAFGARSVTIASTSGGTQSASSRPFQTALPFRVAHVTPMGAAYS
jgi:hypothetical protein